MAVAWSTPEIADKIVGDSIPNQYFILYSVNALKLGNRLLKKNQSSVLNGNI